MSYDICAKKWNDGKDHDCSEIQFHAGRCICVCGAQKMIRDVPIKKWTLPTRFGRRKKDS